MTRPPIQGAEAAQASQCHQRDHASQLSSAGDTSILDERVLNGLKETYNSLGVPIGATVQAIQAMKEVTAGLVGPDAGKEMGVYFDYICSGLGN